MLDILWVFVFSILISAVITLIVTAGYGFVAWGFGTVDWFLVRAGFTAMSVIVFFWMVEDL